MREGGTIAAWDLENLLVWIGMAAFAAFGLCVFFLGQSAANDLELPRQAFNDAVAAIDDLHNRSVSGVCLPTSIPHASPQPSCSEAQTTWLDDRHTVFCTVAVWVDVVASFPGHSADCLDITWLNQSVSVFVTLGSVDGATQAALALCPNVTSRLLTLFGATSKSFPCWCDTADNVTIFAEFPAYPDHPSFTKGVVGTIVCSVLAVCVPIVAAFIIWRLLKYIHSRRRE